MPILEISIVPIGIGNDTLAADIEVIKTENVTQSVLVKPLDQLLEAGALYGVSTITLDRDNVVRRFYWGDPEAPSLEVAGMKMLGISTPTFDAVINLCGVINDTNYWETGRTAQKLGLAGMDLESLKTFLKEGFK